MLASVADSIHQDPVVADEEVPDGGHLPDFVVVEPGEAVEEGAGLGADIVRGERGDVLGGLVHVLDTGDDETVDIGVGTRRDRGGEDVGDVSEVEQVAVDEERLAAVPREVGGEEAHDGELGALGGPARPPVEPRGAGVCPADGVHVKRDGGVPEQAAVEVGVPEQAAAEVWRTSSRMLVCTS
jgi:hypothetical protein